MNSIEHSSQKLFISTLGDHQQVSSEYNTSIIVSIPPIIIPQNDLHVPIIGVENLIIPLSYKMINGNNNKLKLDGVEYIIFTGNYTITSLLVVLNAFNPSLYIFTYDTDDNRLILNLVLLGANTYTIDTGTTCEKLLGCRISAVPYLDNTTFPSIVNLATNTSILVQISNINTANYDNVSGSNNIIAKIPISNQPNQVLNYFNNQPFFSTINNKTIQMLNINLLSDAHLPLILDGNPDWSITLRIDYIKKEAPILKPTAIQQIRKGN
jgi:hypothetical protein